MSGRRGRVALDRRFEKHGGQRKIRNSHCTARQVGVVVSAPRLSGKTHARLLELAWSLSECRTGDELRETSARAMLTLIGADEADYNDVRVLQRAASAHVYPAGSAEGLERVGDDLAQVIDEHPVIRHLSQHPGASPIKLSDLTPHNEFERTRTYEVLFRPRGLRHQLVLPLHLDRSRMMGSALALNRARCDFGESDGQKALGAQLVLSALFGAMSRGQASEAEEARERLKLTPRELEILELVNLGMTAEAIGRSKRLAPSTVRKHLQNVYTKLGLRDRLQVVTYCRRQGLLIDSP
jgi:DNA-binding CsgD family transcriptional regulator